MEVHPYDLEANPGDMDAHPVEVEAHSEAVDGNYGEVSPRRCKGWRRLHRSTALYIYRAEQIEQIVLLNYAQYTKWFFKY